MLKAKLKRNTPVSSFEWLFEPKAGLHNNALEIADVVVMPKNECILLPDCNASGTPTWLKSGQVLGWLQPADVIDCEDNVIEMDKNPDDEAVGDEDRTLADPADDEAVHKINVDTEKDSTGLVNTSLKSMFHLDQPEIDPQERQALEAFLVQNADVFALNNKELGCTDVVALIALTLETTKQFTKLLIVSLLLCVVMWIQWSKNVRSRCHPANIQPLG